MDRFEKILVVKPSSLGDVIHSLAFLSVLKGTYPESTIHWVIAKGLEGILEGHPMIDRLWIIEKDKWKKGSNVFATLGELISLFSSLRNEQYDLVVDLQGLFRSGLIAWAARAPLIIGFEEAREGSRFFYTHRITGGRDIHAVDRYLKVAAFLECDTGTVRFPLPTADDNSLPDSGEYAVLIPGARWATKRWPPERFGKVASMLPLPSVILGSSSDIGIAQTVQEHSAGKATSLAGKTSLRDVARIIGNARFVLTNDTGTMHLAAALGVKVFALFGPTDPKRTGPYGKGHIIIKSDSPCSPCFKKKCSVPHCMENVTVDRVYGTIVENMPVDYRLRDDIR
jgi:lipopolysaccharide heptosyltransferase I